MLAERFVWADSMMDVKPSEKLLEVGCGTGIMLDLLGKKMTSGIATGVDRSEAMVRQARKKNKLLIEQGKVEVVKATFPTPEPPSRSCDKIFAINVNLFWTDDGAAIKNLG